MDKYFYRINEDGNAAILYVDDGTPVTYMVGAGYIYPVGSHLSCAYGDPEGIVLTIEDAEKLGIDCESVAALK